MYNHGLSNQIREGGIDHEIVESVNNVVLEKIGTDPKKVKIVTTGFVSEKSDQTAATNKP